MSYPYHLDGHVMTKEEIKEQKKKHNTDGGKTNYYDIINCRDLDDLAEHLELRGDEFNVMKAIFGIAIARKTGDTRHSGTSIERDAKKFKHYANRIINRLIKK